jgi:hypothetical protein
MPRNQYDELECAAVLEVDEAEQEQSRPADRKRLNRSAERLGRLPTAFVRVPVSWFTTDHRPCPFGPQERLFLLLLHLSRWGQKPVTLTSAVTRQIGLSRQQRLQILKRLEAEGWVRITRRGRRALIVNLITIAGPGYGPATADKWSLSV